MSALEHRIPPPVVFLIVALAMWASAHFSNVFVIAWGLRWFLIGMFLAIGFALAPPAIMAFRRIKTTVDPIHIDRASSLVVSGPFRFTRNPMYLGMASVLFAWATYLSAPVVVLGPIAFVLFITRFQIIPEERAMAVKFGAEYEAYRQSVRRWI
jgi:protein-S-isoprenylcysteine O-methyltransferase Ste14